MKKESREQGRQAQLITMLIDRKIEARLSAIQAALSRLTKEVKRLKPARVQKLEADVNEIKEILKDFNVKNLEEDIFKEFNQMNKKIALALEKQRESLEYSEIEMDHLKTSLQDAKKLKPSAGVTNQDIEALKTKTHWLETEIEKSNVTDLLERMEMLERRIDNLRVSNPMVIE